MASSSPFTIVTKILSLNLLNSVKTFRENSIKRMAILDSSGGYDFLDICAGCRV